MATPPDFSKFVPGFDFLQGLLKTAGQALPDMGQWIAPTVDPLELEKRIEQLKTVQFWLDQNSRMLQASIQALEVQRMTLSTLHSMNVPLSRMADAFQAAASAPPSAATVAAPAPSPPPGAESEPGARGPLGRGPAADKPAGPRATSRKRPGAGSASATSSPAGEASAVDPMKWWGALTQQFGQLAAQALKDMPAATAAAPATAATPAGAAPQPVRPRTARKTRPARPRKA